MSRLCNSLARYDVLWCVTIISVFAPQSYIEYKYTIPLATIGQILDLMIAVDCLICMCISWIKQDRIKHVRIEQTVND